DREPQAHVHPERSGRRLPGGERRAVARRSVRRNRAHRPGEGRSDRPWGLPIERGAQPDPVRDRGVLRLRQLPVPSIPVRLGFGPLSTTTVTANGTPTTFLSYGRGRDLDGDGVIGDGLNDGVGPTGHVPPDGSQLPSRKPIDGLESGLIQTVVDNMALGRALQAGLDIPKIGKNLVDPKRIMYYGISFGGIYGTMLMGTDPLFHQGLMNVPGGPIVDIARLSSFRGDLGNTLARSRPNLLNGGPGRDGFTEDLPLRNDPSEVIKHPGAAALQEPFG